MTHRSAKRAATIGRHGPELALLGILIATASIGFEDRLPVLSVGISLQIPDILLLGSLGWIAVRWLVEPEFRIVRTPLDRPLLVFFGVTLFSTLVGVVRSSVGVPEATQMTRLFSFYLTFFVVTNLVGEWQQLKSLLNGIFVLATIVAVAMIAQYVLGDSVQLVSAPAGGLEQTVGKVSGPVVRIAPPGYSLVMVSFVTVFCTLICEKFRPVGLLRFLQWGIMGTAVLITFFRSYWAALIVVMVLAACLVKAAGRKRLIGWGLMVMTPAAFGLLVVFAAPDLPLSRLVDASWERLSTVGSIETFKGADPSYNMRRLENEYALASISSNPVIGLGLGAAYRPLDPRLDGYIGDLTRHIHNGHLRILVQSGVLGYLSFVWLSVAFLLRGFRNWRNVPNDRLRAVVLGFTLIYLALLISLITNSPFTHSFWTPVIGIVMGINEVILRKVHHESAVSASKNQRPGTAVASRALT